LTFSTRHLNATLEKRRNVEKFNTWHSLFRRFGFIPKPKIARVFTSRKNFNQRSQAPWDYNARRRRVAGRALLRKSESPARGSSPDGSRITSMR
jgi:hypothetical protein